MDSQDSSQASDSRPATRLRMDNRLTTASIDEASKYKAVCVTLLDTSLSGHANGISLIDDQISSRSPGNESMVA